MRVGGGGVAFRAPRQRRHPRWGWGRGGGRRAGGPRPGRAGHGGPLHVLGALPHGGGEEGPLLLADLGHGLGGQLVGRVHLEHAPQVEPLALAQLVLELDERAVLLVPGAPPEGLEEGVHGGGRRARRRPRGGAAAGRGDGLG